MVTIQKFFGFSLIEILIVITIIGVLTAISYPSYTEYVLRSKRADAKFALLQAQLAEEKWRANHFSYGLITDGINIRDISPDNYYTISLSVTPTTYIITATPKAPFVDPSCGSFAINQSGKTISNNVQTTITKVNECWGK